MGLILHVLLTKREVLALRDFVLVNKNTKERGQNPAILTGQASSIKGLLYGQKITPINFTFARTKRKVPSSQDRSILPAQVINQNTGFASPCLLVEPAYNIIA